MTMSATALLDVWERGRQAWPGERALHLLELAEAPSTRDVLARWTVGQRDVALLTLRRHLFGPTVCALADCPGCGESLEMEFPVSAILPQRSGASDAVGVRRTEDRIFTLDADGYRIRYRLPMAGDLAGLSSASGDARRWLLHRCVVSAHRPDGRSDTPTDDGRDGGQPDALAGVDEPGLPAADGIWDALEAALASSVAEHDPQAEVELAMACPACGRQWTTPFDVVGFLWRELDAWASRILREVHVLAAAYGWSERDILALSEWRRRHYLELVGGQS